VVINLIVMGVSLSYMNRKILWNAFKKSLNSGSAKASSSKSVFSTSSPRILLEISFNFAQISVFASSVKGNIFGQYSWNTGYSLCRSLSFAVSSSNMSLEATSLTH
jgi:hypothetical protein